MKLKNSDQRGLALLEQAVVLFVMLALVLGFFDVINIFRARAALHEAALDAASYYSKVGAGLSDGQVSLSEIVDRTQEIAYNAFAVVFPAAKQGCSRSDQQCLLIELHEPQELRGKVQIQMSFTLPLFILARAPIELGTSVSKRMQHAQSASDTAWVINGQEG